MLESSRSFR